MQQDSDFSSGDSDLKQHAKTSRSDSRFTAFVFQRSLRVLGSASASTGTACNNANETLTGQTDKAEMRLHFDYDPVWINAHHSTIPDDSLRRGCNATGYI